MKFSAKKYSPKRHLRLTATNQLLVLFCLTGFAVTEPVLSIFGANPGLFQFHNITSLFLIGIYALVVAFIPALLLQLTTVIVGLIDKGAAISLHVLLAGLLSGLWLLQLAKWSFGIEDPIVLGTFSLLGAIAFVLAYVKWPLVNKWLQMAAIAPLIVVGVFLGTSDTGSLMRKIDLEISQGKLGEPLPSVLFVMLDEFPTMGLIDNRGAIDSARFPYLSILSEQATWYRHYSVLSGSTAFSVPSILAGVEPVEGPASMENFPNNIFSLLAPTHFLTAFETLTELCGLPQCSEGGPGSPIQKPSPQMGKLLAKTLSLWASRVSPKEIGESRLDDFEEEFTKSKPIDQKTQAALTKGFLGPTGMRSTTKKPLRLEKFIETFVDGDHSALYFLHLEMPHLPWRFYDTGELYDLPNQRLPMSPANDDGGAWLAKLSEYRFLMQAQYTDSLFGDIYSRLKSIGIWDEMLVVVTADHGRSFRPNTNGRILAPDTFDSIAYVPLLIKLPNQKRGRVDDSNLIAYDLLPTVADALGVEIPWETVGFPAGHTGIAERGDQKVCFPVKETRISAEGKFLGRIEEKQTFSDKKHFPKYSSRWIGARSSVEDPLKLLNEGLDLDDYFGRTPEEFEVRPGGSVIVDDLALLQRLAPDGAPLGIVMGNLEFQPTGDKVLISVNGRLITGSPLVHFKNVSNTFIAMLPSGALKEQNEIRIFLVEDKHLLELKLIGR